MDWSLAINALPNQAWNAQQPYDANLAVIMISKVRSSY